MLMRVRKDKSSEDDGMPFEKLKDDLRALNTKVEAIKDAIDSDDKLSHRHGVQRALDKASADIETATFWCEAALQAVAKAKLVSSQHQSAKK